METDFTRPGSVSQQDDLRDIQERVARDRRRVSSNTVKINTRKARLKAGKEYDSRANNNRHPSSQQRQKLLALEKGKRNSREKDQEFNQVSFEFECVIDRNTEQE